MVLVRDRVQAAELEDGSVTTAKLADGAVTNVKVNAAAAIAYSKLNLATSILTSDLDPGFLLGTGQGGTNRSSWAGGGLEAVRVAAGEAALEPGGVDLNDMMRLGTVSFFLTKPFSTDITPADSTRPNLVFWGIECTMDNVSDHGTGTLDVGPAGGPYTTHTNYSCRYDDNDAVNASEVKHTAHLLGLVPAGEVYRVVNTQFAGNPTFASFRVIEIPV